MDDKDNLGKIIEIVLLIIASLSPIVGGTITFTESQDLGQSLKTGGLLIVSFLIGWLAYAVLKKVVGRIVGRSADKIDNWLLNQFSRFRKKYLQHLIYRHRDFDVKGLSTQGIYTLELEPIRIIRRLGRR